jgi:hypothetical protein
VVRKVIHRTRRLPCSARKVTIRYTAGGQTVARAPTAEPRAIAGPEAPPPWHGQRVTIEDLPAFAARRGLLAVRGEWPAGEACPRLYFVEVQLFTPRRQSLGGLDRGRRWPGR